MGLGRKTVHPNNKNRGKPQEPWVKQTKAFCELAFRPRQPPGTPSFGILVDKWGVRKKICLANGGFQLSFGVGKGKHASNGQNGDLLRSPENGPLSSGFVLTETMGDENLLISRSLTLTPCSPTRPRAEEKKHEVNQGWSSWAHCVDNFRFTNFLSCPLREYNPAVTKSRCKGGHEGEFMCSSKRLRWKPAFHLRTNRREPRLNKATKL